MKVVSNLLVKRDGIYTPLLEMIKKIIQSKDGGCCGLILNHLDSILVVRLSEQAQNSLIA